MRPIHERLGFGYLLFVGLDARIAAFQGELILGYFLRIWENMTVYERILQDDEEAVADELEEQVPTKADERLAQQLRDQLEDNLET